MPQVRIIRTSEVTISRRSPQGASPPPGAGFAPPISAAQYRHFFAAARISFEQAGQDRTTVELQCLQTLSSSGISPSQKGHFLIPRRLPKVGRPPLRE